MLATRRRRSRTPGAAPRVVMIVLNEVEFDNRVRREARLVRDAGAEVEIVGAFREPSPEPLLVDEIPVHRLAIRSRLVTGTQRLRRLPGRTRRRLRLWSS